MRRGALLALGAIAVAVAGCGSGSDATVKTSHSSQVPVTRESSARREGRRACRELEPQQVAKKFEKAAFRAGVRRRFAELATNPSPAIETSAGYPRLVAALYAATLEPSRRAAAAAGCTEELVAQMGAEKENERKRSK